MTRQEEIYHQEVFPASAHGFKLSPTFNNRLYYYPDEDYNMTIRDIPNKRWSINNIFEDKNNKVVILKSERK